MAHPNEERLRVLYAAFARGDLQGFLAGCSDDVSFTVPGDTPASGVYTKETFVGWITGVLAMTAGTFEEHVLDVFANDEHGVLQLRHEFDRDGVRRVYLTSHACELRDGLIARWEERPGSLVEFEAAWGTRGDAAAGPALGAEWFDRYLEAWNSHDPARVVEFMAEDAAYEDLALGVAHEGREAIAAFVAQASAFSSDHRFVAVSVQTDCEAYAAEWEMVGTNDGAAAGLPPTNKPYRIRGVSIGVLDGNGRIRRNRDYWNMADYLAQVGLLPPPPS
jgi:steroid delta-isomerase-like uncharacterized protein